MATLFRITVRNDQDEILEEFESTQPVVHVDVPEGRYLITVRCVEAQPRPAIPARRGLVH